MSLEISAQQTDQLRSIALEALLVWHGFNPEREGTSFRVKTDRHNIVTTGPRWFDNKAGTGGVGAINLQIHLTGQKFSDACHTLADQFRPLAATQRQETEPPAEKLTSREPARRPFHELVAKYAVRDDANWPVARAYLVEKRGVCGAVVDKLHETGSIYANNHRPNPSLVFLHRTTSGSVVGATLRDTRHESDFCPTLGNKLHSWFKVGDLAQAPTVVAVESPIDALSYYCLKAARPTDLAVVSCSGATVPTDLMFQAYDARKSFVVAFDNDRAGERGWQKAWDETADWTGFKISSDCPRLKDWNDDLRAITQHQRPQQQTNSLKL